MSKTATKKNKASNITIDRRREWRLGLPLTAKVEGKLPQDKTFLENTTLENISSTGALFGLDAGVIVGSKLNLIIEVPDKLTDGNKVKLCLEGIVIRLEESMNKKKKQGVAMRFDEEFHFVAE